MNNPIESSNKYGQISWDIGKFDDIQSQLKEGWEILLGVKAKYGKEHELYKKFEKEYQDLYETIKKAFESEKNFSQEERAKIKMELGDMIVLAEQKGILEKKAWYSSLGDVLKKTDTKEAKSQALSFRDKKVQDYTQAEAISAMEYLSSKYTEYKDVGNDDKLSKGLTFQYSSISQLDDRYEVRLFQDELVKKIFGDGKQFNDKYVLSFNQERGNFLMKIEDFETNLKDDKASIRDINSRALGNYFLLLKSKGQLTGEKVIDIFGTNKLYELREVWEKKDEGDGKIKVAKQIMQENGLGDIIKIIELFSSPDNFLQGVQDLGKNQDQAKIAFKLFEKNTNAIKEQFKKSLKEKFLKSNPGKEKDADKIIDEMLVELEKYKSIQSLPQILKVFHNYNEQHKLGLSISEETKKLIDIRKQENKLEIIKNVQEKQQALEAKDEKAIEKATKKEQQLSLQAEELNAMKGVVSHTSDGDAKKIISGEIKYEDYVADLMKKDESLRQSMMIFQQQQIQFYEQYPEEKDILSFSQGGIDSEIFVEVSTHANMISYPDGSFLPYEPISGGNYKVNDVEVSYGELQVIKKNKEAYKNMENFNQTLQELNLEGLWKYRQPLFTAISSKYVGVFEVENDYMNQREIKIFISSVLSSLGISLSPNIPIDEFKQKVKYINKVGVIGGQEEVNLRGEGYIENQFLDTFDPKRSGIIHPHTVQEKIGNLFGGNT